MADPTERLEERLAVVERALTDGAPPADLPDATEELEDRIDVEAGGSGEEPSEHSRVADEAMNRARAPAVTPLARVDGATELGGGTATGSAGRPRAERSVLSAAVARLRRSARRLLDRPRDAE